FYRVCSAVNGGRRSETDLFEGVRTDRIGPGQPDGAEQPERRSPISMDGATFRTLGHRLVEQVAGLLESLPRRPVTHDESPSKVREALGVDDVLPEQGTEPGPVLDSTASFLFEHSLVNAHPRFLGYITAPPAPIGILR